MEPLRIAVATIGSQGDIEPALALACGLARDGAAVSFVGPPAFRASVERHGLRYVDLEPSIPELDAPDERESKLTRLRKFRIGREHIIRQFDRVVAAAAEADVLLAAITFAPAALTARDLHGISVGLFNVVVPFVPTGEVANPWLFALPFGRPGRRLSYKAFEQLLWQPVRGPVNRWRRRLGLARFPPFGFFNRLYEERVPMLLAWSPALYPQHPDYPPAVYVTGSWLPSTDSTHEPEPRIARYLAEEREPICITFGSNPIAERARVQATLAEALRRGGRRAILAAGASGLDQGAADLPELIVVQRIPFTWLFSKLALAIHHGGCGVTNLALDAGIPAVVVPTRPDQLALGRRLAELGVAPRPMPLRKLDADALAGAIDRALGDRAMREAAARFARRITTEDGVGRAVKIVREWAQARTPRP